MSEQTGKIDLSETPPVVGTTFQFAHLFKHMQNPQNLLTYMVFTAWCKFMGVAEYLPSITVG
jgi:ABC-type molybdate transport system ATPase subunit